MTVYQQMLDRQDCVLLLVDLQKSMLELCVDADRVYTNIGALIETAELMEIPIICSEHNPEKLGGFLPDLREKMAKPNVLPKIEFNCFDNEGLAWAIRKTGRRTILLAGIEGHVCIFHTGTGALRLGCTVHVIHDAVTSRRASDKEIGMHRLDRSGAVISSTEMMIFELLGRAGTSEFRALLPMFKRLQSS